MPGPLRSSRCTGAETPHCKYTTPRPPLSSISDKKCKKNIFPIVATDGRRGLRTRGRGGGDGAVDGGGGDGGDGDAGPAADRERGRGDGGCGEPGYTRYSRYRGGGGCNGCNYCNGAVVTEVTHTGSSQRPAKSRDFLCSRTQPARTAALSRVAGLRPGRLRPARLTPPVSSASSLRPGAAAGCPG